MNIDFNETQLIALYQNMPQILKKEVVEVVVTTAFVQGNAPRGKKLTLEKVGHGDYWVVYVEQNKGLLFPKPNHKINQYEYKTVQKIFNCQGYEESKDKNFIVKQPAQVTLTATRKEYELESKGVLNFVSTSTKSRLELDLIEAQEKNRQLKLQLSQSPNENQESGLNLGQLQQNHELMMSELTSHKSISQQIFQRLENQHNLFVRFVSLWEKKEQINNDKLNNVLQRLEAVENLLQIQTKEKSQSHHNTEQLKQTSEVKVNNLAPDSGQVSSDSADYYYNTAVLHSSSGEYKKAIVHYEKAIALNGDDADAYHDKGVAYYKLGEYKTAIADYNKAIELQPDNAQAYYDRGVAHSKLGEYKRAIVNYEKAIELKPDHAQGYNCRGYAYYKLEWYQKAIDDYDKAIEINPNKTIYHENRNLAFVKSKNKKTEE